MKVSAKIFAHVVNGVLGLGRKLLVAIRDATLGEVVWGHFESDAIASENTDSVAPQFSGEVGENDSLLV